jgi:hypothetical protein
MCSIELQGLKELKEAGRVPAGSEARRVYAFKGQYILTIYQAEKKHTPHNPLILKIGIWTSVRHG